MQHDKNNNMEENTQPLMVLSIKAAMFVKEGLTQKTMFQGSFTLYT